MRKLHHILPKTELLPRTHNQPTYGAMVKYDKFPDEVNHIGLKKFNIVQEILGTLLHYAIATENTILVTEGTIVL